MPEEKRVVGVQPIESPSAEAQKMLINMGPQHPSTHGVFRMIVTLDGEQIAGIDCYLGYLHRGIEKLAERRTYGQIIPLCDRLDYISAVQNEFAYVQAVEKLAGIEVPERAEYIRVILAEFQRISSHLAYFGFTGLEAGATTPMFVAFMKREKIVELFEMVSGARLMYNFFRIGGVKEDLPEGFEKTALACVEEMTKALDEFDNLLSGNEIFINRLKGVGVLPAKKAIEVGATGPNLRGSGILCDLRKTEPYSVYDRFDFEVPLGKNGDTYDRYLIRMQEMRQSLRIIAQAIDSLPSGKVRTDVPGIIKPEGEAYGRAEGTRGEVGFYLVGNGTEYPYRMKIRAPSFINIYSVTHMAIGGLIADLVMTFGSVDTCMGECDR